MKPIQIRHTHTHTHTLTFSWLKYLSNLISRNVRKQNMAWSKGKMRLMATIWPVGLWTAELFVHVRWELYNKKNRRCVPDNAIGTFTHHVYNLVLVSCVELLETVGYFFTTRVWHEKRKGWEEKKEKETTKERLCKWVDCNTRLATTITAFGALSYYICYSAHLRRSKCYISTCHLITGPLNLKL